MFVKKKIARGLFLTKKSNRICYTKKGDGMVVYIDVVFLLALIQDTALLTVAGICLKEKTNWLRIISGGIIGAVYQLVCLFYSLSSVLLSIFVAFLQVLTAYNNNRISITCFFMAEAVFVAGVMYLFRSTYSGLLFFATLAGVPYAVFKIKNYIRLSKLNKDLEIEEGKNKISLSGFIDSGNSLNVIIIGKSHAEKIIGSKRAEQMLLFKEGRYEAIPCTTVKGHTLLPVFTAKRVKVDGRIYDLKIGVMKEDLPYALLPMNFLKMGDMDDKKTDTQNKEAVPW